MGAAAEAVVELLVLADGEGGGLLVVEGATGLVILAGLAQLDAAADQIDDVGAGEEVIDELRGDSAGHGIEPSRRAKAAVIGRAAGSDSEAVLHQGADGADVGPALDLGLEDGHDLAHVAHDRRPLAITAASIRAAISASSRAVGR